MLSRISAELGKTGDWQYFRQYRNTMHLTALTKFAVLSRMFWWTLAGVVVDLVKTGSTILAWIRCTLIDFCGRMENTTEGRRNSTFEGTGWFHALLRECLIAICHILKRTKHIYSNKEHWYQTKRGSIMISHSVGVITSLLLLLLLLLFALIGIVSLRTI